METSWDIEPIEQSCHLSYSIRESIGNTIVFGLRGCRRVTKQQLLLASTMQKHVWFQRPPENVGIIIHSSYIIIYSWHGHSVTVILHSHHQYKMTNVLFPSNSQST
jgi:hypothetical protein